MNSEDKYKKKYFKYKSKYVKTISQKGGDSKSILVFGGGPVGLITAMAILKNYGGHMGSVKTNDS